MVGLDGEKMSKSRGNLVFVSRLRQADVDPRALRLALLSAHYRADREWSPSILEAAQGRLASWQAGVARSSGPAGAEVVARLRAALADDLDTPRATAVDDWCAAKGEDTGAGALVAEAVDALLGVDLR